jgi:hypothetical protein
MRSSVHEEMLHVQRKIKTNENIGDKHADGVACL